VGEDAVIGVQSRSRLGRAGLSHRPQPGRPARRPERTRRPTRWLFR
jgi:hypothetical protein